MVDWATTDALMERALVNWRSIKDREPGSDTSDLALSLNICESAMTEAEEAYKLYVRGIAPRPIHKPSSIHKPIPRPEQVPTGPSTSPYLRLHKPIPTTSITKTLLPTIKKATKQSQVIGAKARELQVCT